MNELTDAERDWLVRILLNRAERKARNAADAITKERHPGLIDRLREESGMCERVAAKLAGCTLAGLRKVQP